MVVMVVSLVILFSGLAPVTNTALYANGSGTNGTGLNSVVNVWNNSGYPAAQQVANQLPVLEVLLGFGIIATVLFIVIRTL